MEKISTNHSLKNYKNNYKKDELAELKLFLKDNAHDYQDVQNYLEKLKKDVSDQKIREIMEFARQYKAGILRKENVEAR